MLKKILKFTLIFFLVVVAFLLAAPFLFRGKIISLVKSEINKSINGKADFKDVNLSFFRHFPKVSVALRQLHVTGVDEFSNDTLIAAKEIDLSLDVMSVIRGKNMKLYSVKIDEPRIHAIVNKEGKANWDIVKPDTAISATTEKTKPFKLNLQQYAVKNGYMNYTDAASNMDCEIFDLNHEGSGDFTADLFTLKTKTSAAEVNFNYGGIPYLSKTKATVNTDLQIDNTTGKYSFKTGDIALNDLKLASEGFFQMLNDSVYNMDIQFNAPSTDFKNILSLIPLVYSKDFAKVKTSGKAIFNGFVKGTYSSNQLPAYAINLDVKDGYFQYPDLPRPVKNINFAMKVDNPDGITDHTVIDIPKGHIEFDDEPFDFRLLVKNPVSDLFVNAAAKGKLDLSKITQYIKLEAGTKLQGLLNADVAVDGNVSAIEKQQFDQFNANGTINLHDFFYSSKEYPDGVTLKTLLMTFNPKKVTIGNLAGQYMKTNFTADGTINNLLAYVLKNQPLDGSLNITADNINLNDWMKVSTDTATKGTEAAQPFAVPNNIQFVINARAGKVHYDKVDIENLSGSLQIANETVKLNNIKGNALDGTMNINGSYSTKENKKQPQISLTYDVKNFDVEKTFFAFNTVQKLMPVAKFIAGKLNSQLTFTGKLGDNMMPDLNSLNGNGNLLLIEGFLSKFQPLEKLATLLNVNELQQLSVRDIKNYIEFTNGKVLIKPFTIKVKGIEMEIAGMHGFDQSLDYALNLKIPRSMMGDKGNQYVNNLVTQVNNKGVPLKVGDVVNLQVKMGGTIINPILKTDLKQAGNNLVEDMKKQATEFAKAKIDSTKTAVTTAVKDSLESARKQVAKGAADEIKKQLFGKKDSTTNPNAGVPDTKKKLEETGKGLYKKLNPFNKKKQEPDSVKGN